MTKEEATKYVPLIQWLNSAPVQYVEVFPSSREYGVRAVKNAAAYGFTVCAEPPDVLFHHERGEYLPLSLGVALYTLATGKTIV